MLRRFSKHNINTSRYRLYGIMVVFTGKTILASFVSGGLNYTLHIARYKYLLPSLVDMNGTLLKNNFQ